MFVWLARWLTLGLLVLVPWPYAGVPPAVTEWLARLGLGLLALWALGFVLQWRAPRVRPLLVVACGLIMGQGWLAIGNAQFSYNFATFSYLPANPWWASPWAPGGIDAGHFAPLAMREISALLGVLLILVDLAGEERWRSRLIGSVVFGGMGIVLFGLAQRVARANLGFWDTPHFSPRSFASFYYHGNAGAFVNLLIPVLTGWTMRGWRAGDLLPWWRRLAPVLGLVLVFAASVAIASKAAMIFAPLLLCASIAAFWRREAPWRVSPWLLGAALALAVIGAGFLAANSRARERWQELPKLMTRQNARLLAWQAELRMIPDAGPWGLGPGNFPLAFPHYTYGLDRQVMGWWQYAHQDYLQTLLEWGPLGFLWWAGVWLGYGWKPALRWREFHREERFARKCALLSLAGLLVHATLDYPLQIPAIQLYAAGWLAILWSQRPGPLLQASLPGGATR